MQPPDAVCQTRMYALESHLYAVGARRLHDRFWNQLETKRSQQEVDKGELIVGPKRGSYVLLSFGAFRCWGGYPDGGYWDGGSCCVDLGGKE